MYNTAQLNNISPGLLLRNLLAEFNWLFLHVERNVFKETTLQ